jgi:hypothetical protein
MASVTLDKVVQNVGTFKGDIKEQRRDYERAKQGVELLDNDLSKEKLEDALRRASEYSEFNIPTAPVDTEIVRGDVSFNVRSEATTKRPQYKTAVTGIENYINGTHFLVNNGHTITGVVKEGNKWYVATDTLLEHCEIMLASIMIPDIKQTITYILSGDLSAEPTPKTIDLGSQKSSRALNAENFANYARRDRLRQDLSKFVESYELALSQEEKTGEGIVQVNTRAGYKEEKIKSKGANWAYVAKTLIRIKEKDDEGELNMLADSETSLASKKRELPFYDLRTRDVRGSEKVYVSLQSVYDRIQDLKEQEVIKSSRSKIKAQEIV